MFSNSISGLIGILNSSQIQNENPALYQVISSIINSLIAFDKESIALNNPARGQISFPTSPNFSDNPYTIDNYQEGEWTPTITFDTPGNLAVVYSNRVGTFTKIGNLVRISFVLTTTTFTHTTAAGSLRINGLPFTSNKVIINNFHFGGMQWQGITKAGYTHVTPRVPPGVEYVSLNASGSGVNTANVAFGDMPTGGNLNLSGTIVYQSEQ